MSETAKKPWLTQYGVDQYSNRKAIVYRYVNYNVVEFYKDDELVESNTLTGFSINYAEDTAENWVLGVINETPL